MDLDIDSLIIRPGMFVVSPDKRYRVTGQEEPEGKKLDIFKDNELAHSVYQEYAMCHNTAVDLISDAEILLAAGKYARSCALAIMAWEELGKSQIAATTILEYLPTAGTRRPSRNTGSRPPT